MNQIAIPINTVRRDELKTINNQSLIGSGNITITGGDGGGEQVEREHLPVLKVTLANWGER